MKTYALLCVALLAGCSGGGGPSVPAAGTPAPQATAGSSSKTASTKVSITIPKRPATTSNARHRSFVSSSTEGIVVSVFTDPMASNPTALETVGVDLTSDDADCTAPVNDGARTRHVSRSRHDVPQATGLTCTFTIPVAIGKTDFTFTTYDQPPSAAGVPVAGSNELGTAELTTTIVPNEINQLNVALDGMPASVSISQGAPGGAMVFAGNAIDASYGVTVYDADQNIIVNGNTVSNGSSTTTDGFSTPVVLTLTEPHGGNHTHLSLGDAAPSTSVTLTNSGDAGNVMLAYDGQATAPYHAVVTATLAGSTTPIGTAQFLPVFVSGSGDGYTLGANGTPSLALHYAYDPVTLTLSEDDPSATFEASISANLQENGPCVLGSVESTPSTISNGGSFSIESGKFPDTTCSFYVQDANTFAGIPVPGSAVAQTLYVAIPGTNEIDAIGVPIGAGHADSTIAGAHLTAPMGVAHGPFTSLYATTTSAPAGADAFTLSGTSTIAGTETAQFAGGSYSAIAIDTLDYDPVLSNAAASQSQYEMVAQKFAGASNPDTAIVASGATGPATSSITEDSFSYIFEALAGSAEIVLYPYQAVSRGLNAPFQQQYPIAAPAKGIVCDLAGHLYVADGSSTITEYASPIGYTTLTSIATFVDTSANFTGVSVDGAGNVFGVGTKSGAGFAEEFVANSTQRYSESLPGVPGQVTM